ncbi:MAG TPA: adenylate/guanylate cyclase domain-containing protein [Anaerolineales bacterium]|nr:adenylate/guanylate cyclase domain-containing protein [Anaerolineales bacterium]
MAATAPFSTQEKLLQYIPKELLAKLEAARAGHSMEGERRVVTILFCDVKGSTAAAESMDPEDWAEVMNGAFEHLIAPIYRLEGTLARLMGDAILAFFGAPIAHEDDPERAVLAGLQIVNGIAPYRDQVHAQWGLDFNVRVGINTGLVVVGEVGSDLRLEYTAMGDAVNLAARMEQTATPGTVQVAEETYQRAAPLFEWESLGPVSIKGKAEPVPAYRALTRKERPRRLRGIEGLYSPLVGRLTEMSVLHESLDGLGRGHGGIVALIGEAGLGKSRMIDELHSSWESGTPGGYWGESRGISYETTRPYAQFQQQLLQLCGVVQPDDLGEVRRKLASVVAEFPQDEQARAGLALQAVLGAEDPQDGGTLEGEALRRELYRTCAAVWRRQAARQPTVLVFDDLHWSDPASTELLIDLFRLTDAGPILFLCAFRPDRQAPAWQVKQAGETVYPHRYREVVLQPLSSGSSRELVDHLLSVSDLPPKLHSLIEQKAEGNPFFVEEVIRTLIDRGAVLRDANGTRWKPGTDIDEIAIPDNLQGLLVARIDRLADETRRTLQLASVVGRTFYYRVLQAISEAADELDGRLSDLQRSELIREAARDPELEYAFRHALTQEAAYGSILRKERRLYHLRVGDALERLFPDRLSDLAPLLAHHFFEAADERALKYAVLAGDQAFRMYAIESAIQHYRRALDLELRSPTEDTQLLRRLYTQLGRSYELIDRFDAALELYQQMRATGHERSDGEMELSSLMESAKIFSTPNQLFNADRGRAASDEAVQLARQIDNHQAEARILWNRMNSENYLGEMSSALEFGKRSLAIAEEFNLKDQLAFTLNDLTLSLLTLGQVDRAQEVNQRARALWKELGNLPMLADNYSTWSFGALWLGEFEQAVVEAEEAYRITKSIDNTWGQATSRLWIGLAYLEQGRFEAALEVQRDGLRLALEAEVPPAVMFMGAFLGMSYGVIGSLPDGFAALKEALQVDPTQFLSFACMPRSVLARLHLWNGDIPQARLAMQSSYEGFKPVGSMHAADQVLITDAEIELAAGDSSKAIERIDQMLSLARAAGRRLYLPEALLLRGRALLAQSALTQAGENLQEAHQWADQLGSRRVLWQILLEQSRLAAKSGDPDRAEQLRAAAGQAVIQLTASISNPDLRRSFAALPDAREALAGQVGAGPTAG